MASLVSGLIAYTAWCATRAGDFMRQADLVVSDLGAAPGVALMVVGLVVVIVILNCIPDYVSLLETRALIGLMRRADSVVVIVLVLILDVIITSAIASSALIFLATLVEGLPGPRDIGRIVTRAFTFQLRGASALFYAAFFTSVWLWLYALAAFAIKASVYLNVSLKTATWMLDVDEKPFTSLGTMSIVIITALFVLIVPVLLWVVPGDATLPTAPPH